MEEMEIDFDDANFEKSSETKKTQIDEQKADVAAVNLVEKKTKNKAKETSNKESSASSSLEEILLKKLEELSKQQEQQAKIIEHQNEVIANLSLKKVEAVKQQSGDGFNIGDNLVSLIQELKDQNTKPKFVKVINLTNYAQCQYETTPGNYITFKEYGQSFPVSESDAEILLNKYMPSFRVGALAFDADHMYLLKEKGIDVEKINYHPIETIENAPNMSIDDLKKAFYGMAVYQRDMLKMHIVGKIMEGKDFLPIDTVRRLNVWSKNIMGTKQGGYEQIIARLESKELEEE